MPLVPLIRVLEACEAFGGLLDSVVSHVGNLLIANRL